ncbi:hypothetical protein HK101_010171 [Irineochytrium annulatum]|nr:hypothetical protein HK101_010171 [Irineochytrium annulatum]
MSSSVVQFDVVGLGANLSHGAIVAEGGWGVASTVHAAVQLKAGRVLKDAKVVVELRGVTETRWTGAKPMDVGDRNPNKVAKRFLQLVEVVRDKREALQPNEFGIITLPFKIDLPKSGLPSTYEDRAGTIKYYFKATLAYQDGMKLLKSHREIEVPLIIRMPEFARQRLLTTISPLSHTPPFTPSKCAYTIHIPTRTLEPGQHLIADVSITSTPANASIRLVNASLRGVCEYTGNERKSVVKFPRPLSEICESVGRGVGGAEAEPWRRRWELRVTEGVARPSCESPLISVKTFFRFEIVLDTSEIPNVAVEVPIVIVPNLHDPDAVATSATSSMSAAPSPYGIGSQPSPTTPISSITRSPNLQPAYIPYQQPSPIQHSPLAYAQADALTSPQHAPTNISTNQEQAHQHMQTQLRQQHDQLQSQIQQIQNAGVQGPQQEQLLRFYKAQATMYEQMITQNEQIQQQQQQMQQMARSLSDRQLQAARVAPMGRSLSGQQPQPQQQQQQQAQQQEVYMRRTASSGVPLTAPMQRAMIGAPLPDSGRRESGYSSMASGSRPSVDGARPSMDEINRGGVPGSPVASWTSRSSVDESRGGGGAPGSPAMSWASRPSFDENPWARPSVDEVRGVRPSIDESRGVWESSAMGGRPSVDMARSARPSVEETRGFPIPDLGGRSVSNVSSENVDSVTPRHTPRASNDSVRAATTALDKMDALLSNLNAMTSTAPTRSSPLSSPVFAASPLSPPASPAGAAANNNAVLTGPHNLRTSSRRDAKRYRAIADHEPLIEDEVELREGQVVVIK